MQAILKNSVCGRLGLRTDLSTDAEGGSQLFALVGDAQLELPALKTHQHAAKFVPANLPTINDEKRHAAIAGIVPLNPTAHDSLFRDLQSVLAVREMLCGQGTAHLFDQSPEQNQQVFLRITDDLELVASRMSTAKFEGVERDSGPEQMGAEVKLMDFSSRINETHRLGLGVFESCQPGCFRDFLVEALATEMSISAFNGAVVDDVVARGDAGATITTSFPASRQLSLMIHVQSSIANPFRSVERHLRAIDLGQREPVANEAGFILVRESYFDFTG